MPRVTHTNHAKVTAWTKTVKAEFSGSLLACSIELFRTLELAQMERALEKMLEIQAQREENAKATA